MTSEALVSRSSAAVLYRLRTETRIAPLGDRAREALVANRPLAEQQARAAAGAGLSVVDVEPGEVLPSAGFLLFDDVFASRDALRAFVAGAPSGRAVLALADSVFARNTAWVQGNVEEPSPSGEGGPVHLFDLFRVEAGALPGGDREAVAAALREGARRAVVDPEERVLRIPVQPHYFGTDQLEIGMAGRCVIRLRHWMHLLQLNHMALGLRWREQGRGRLLLRGIWAALRALSLNKHRVLGKLNTIGKGCDIHPTAVVEGSVLGDHVTIGPHARVLFSELGDHVYLQPNAQVQFTMVGHHAMISQHAFVNFCTVYPEASPGMHGIQLCVLGRGAVLTTGGYLMDTHFGRNIRVTLDGQLVDSGQKFLGCAMGHRAILGSGVWIPAGRDLPGDLRIVRDPQLVGGRLDDLDPERSAPLTMTIRAGRITLL